MKGTWWAAGVLTLASVMVPAPSRADHDGDTYGIAYERGFRDGSGHGGKDARNGEDFNFAHDRKFYNADKGYRSYYGPRPEYAAGYRAGYRDGYRSGYYGQHRYGYRYGDRYGYGSNDRYRHRHPGVDGWCYERHDRDDGDDDDVIFEIPRY